MRPEHEGPYAPAPAITGPAGVVAAEIASHARLPARQTATHDRKPT